MRHRGYAAAFVLVLLAALVGGFLGGRLLIQRLQQDFGPSATWAPPTQSVAGASRLPTVTPRPAGLPTQTPTRSVLEVPTPVEIEPVPTSASGALPTVTAPDKGTVPVDVTLTPSETPAETPTAPPTPAFPFSLVGSVRNTTGDCPGNYILGRVTDRAGNPLPDVQLLLTDEYGNQERKSTKSGADAGRYDFPLFGPPRRFFLSMVDVGGRALSPRIEISHGVGANPTATCHRADWRQR